MSKSYVPGNDLDGSELRELLAALLDLRQSLVDEENNAARLLSQVHPERRSSAVNLLHYMALRRRDLRNLQGRLAALGLSSLGRAESHVLSSLDSVINALHWLSGTEDQISKSKEAVLDFAHGEALLESQTRGLLGVANSGRDVRIMVTMPSEAADNPRLIKQLLFQGMNCMRINCAHDAPDIWLRMIKYLESAKKELGYPCKIVMDLGGPKLRTGPLSSDLNVLKLRPKRDEFGRVLETAKLWLTSNHAPVSVPEVGMPALKVDPEWLQKLDVGDQFHLVDARDARRRFEICYTSDAGVIAECGKTTYFVPNTSLNLKPEGSGFTTPLYAFPSENACITLNEGDSLILSRDTQPGRAAERDSTGAEIRPAIISCSLPEVFADVCPGHSIWFDDGRIGGVIRSVDTEAIIVLITHAPPKGGKLRADKGINLPDSQLSVSAMSKQDQDDMAFIAKHADIVELSFANSVRDVEHLQQSLKQLKAGNPSIVLKIETRQGFENLPEMLMTAMQEPFCGVMIARGDLAVECGFERMAEVQEEILWICEAAHIPVIWATQVLESLAKTGLPSRAEVTDAAMGHRAECVMLNKGPFILSAVRALDDILRRMQAHQRKKSSMLRELNLARPLPLSRYSEEPG